MSNILEKILIADKSTKIVISMASAIGCGIISGAITRYNTDPYSSLLMGTMYSVTTIMQVLHVENEELPHFIVKWLYNSSLVMLGRELGWGLMSTKITRAAKLPLVHIDPRPQHFVPPANPPANPPALVLYF